MTGTIAFLLALTAVMVVLAIISVFWAIKSGQYEDLEGPAQRILMDEDDAMIPGAKRNYERSVEKQ